ncbi:uncharacterized protein LOC134729455 [Pan paniscus]|uniref:uncharacterized protein LOC134729455 n=1 Tax=Pan paniscus TaxID=9597 RepID=UPI0030059FD4
MSPLQARHRAGAMARRTRRGAVSPATCGAMRILRLRVCNLAKNTQLTSAEDQRGTDFSSLSTSFPSYHSCVLRQPRYLHSWERPTGTFDAKPGSRSALVFPFPLLECSIRDLHVAASSSFRSEHKCSLSREASYSQNLK